MVLADSTWNRSDHSPESVGILVKHQTLLCERTPERLIRKVNANGYVLQHLTVNRAKRRAFLFDGRQEGVLVIQGKRLIGLLISILALGKQEVEQPTTFIKHTAHLSGLPASRIYAIEERFTHLSNYCTKEDFRQPESSLSTWLLRSGRCIPIAKATGFSVCECW